MATAVVDILVPASLDLLLGKLKELTTKLDDPLYERLISRLESLQGLVNDAEEKQFNDRDVKKWLVRLRDAVFDAEDLFDQINTEKLRCELKAEALRHVVFDSEVLKFKSSYMTINSEMKELLERLDRFAKHGQSLGLTIGVSSSVWHETQRLTSCVAEDESDIYGRDNDLEKLKDLLLFEDASEQFEDAREGVGKIGVVSIVGMGGLGKTTLAKLLYHDPEVDQKFDLKAWAHISKDFDVLKVTKALLESFSISSKPIEANNLDALQVKLQKSLNGKMFLLVLDDIWGVDYIVWNHLQNIFNVGEAGSRIVITTRNQRDALTMRTFLPIHYLERLGSEDCWSLLAKHAFGASNYQQHSDLEEIGRQIAQKCDGLPLAAKELGGLLRNKLSLHHWIYVLESNIWELIISIVPTLQRALLLSYLPAPLKQCFAFCAIFPKNSIIEKKMVVQLWIAEGLVLHPKSEKSWEKVGEEYFDELVLRSLIHRRYVDGKEMFQMHDFMNALATMVSYPYCIRLDEQEEIESLDRVRHLSYTPNAYSSYIKFGRLRGLRGMHTFLSLPLQEPQLSDYCMSDKEVQDLLREMKHLHSLSLSQCSKITKVPTSIGNLIYLRYLNLSGTPIVRLPSETCKLFNLQTLLMSNCRSLIELPEDMGKLVNLRNLDVSGTPLREMPVQIAKLNNLQTLSNFIVGKQCDGLKVGELGKFPHLRGNLSISELQNVTNHSDATQANLETKKQIDELILKWHHPAPLDSNLPTQSVVLEQLKPTVNLMSLAIDGYGGTKFPNWLGDSSYGNMVYLEIKNCDNCSRLPPLGRLCNLKELFIEGMKSVKRVGDEFYGIGSGSSFKPFPSLETLSFVEMSEWEEWKLIGGATTEFPVLRRLTLNRCLKLKGKIPTNLPCLIDMEIYDLQKLQSIAKESFPINLRRLVIGYVGGALWNTIAWEHLTCLSELQIQSPDIVKGLMKMKGPLLPTSLISLHIFNLPLLESLDGKWLHHLTSLTSFGIHCAPKLNSLPEEGFPSSLSELRIYKCPLLEARLQDKQGKEWNKVAHIPSIKIDYVDIK